MKIKIKYLFLLLISVFLLIGCGKKQEDNIPTEVLQNLPAQSEQFLKQIYAMSDLELTQTIENAENSDQNVLASGLESFKDTRETVGELVSIDDTDISVVEKNYVVKIIYSGEHRKSELTLGFEQRTNRIAMFSVTPKYSMAENMERAALNTLLGMGTVFIVLIIISFLISLFKYVSVFEEKLLKKKEKKPEVIVPKEVAPVPETKPEDDMELVAVITAAIAGFSKTDASNLIVRSIKRVKKR